MSDWTSESETKCHRCGRWNTTGQGCTCLARSARSQEKSDPHPESPVAYSCNYCGPGSVCHCDEEDEGDNDEPRECSRCGGEGWVECSDPLGCTGVHTKDGLCRCKSCGGGGSAKDMTIW